MSATVETNPQESLIEIEADSLSFSEQCKAIVIVDQPTYNRAVELRVTVKSFLDRASKFFEPMREKAYAAYQQVLTQKRAVLDPAEKNLAVLDGAISRFVQEQRRLEEKRRREAEIEQQRIAEMERQSGAVDAIDSGADEESVEAILQEPIVPTPVKVEPTYQKSEAISTVDNFKARIKDLKKFVKYVAKEVDKNPGVLPLLLGIKSIDGGFESPGLNKMAKAQQGLLAIPGVEVYNDAFVKSAGRR